MSARYHIFAVWTGGAALMAAAATDTASVVARSLVSGLHGAIELIQLFVLVAGALALVIATGRRAHARVHLVTDRLSGTGKDMADRFSAVCLVLLVAGLLAGSAWIAADMWHGHEISEVLGIPWKWMRLFANLCFAVVIAILLRQAVRGQR